MLDVVAADASDYLSQTAGLIAERSGHVSPRERGELKTPSLTSRVRINVADRDLVSLPGDVIRRRRYRECTTSVYTKVTVCAGLADHR